MEGGTGLQEANIVLRVCGQSQDYKEGYSDVSSLHSLSSTHEQLLTDRLFYTRNA